jgi:integrase
VVARDGSGPKTARFVTSCAECLAWGWTYAQGVCLACYNFAARNPLTGDCAGCGRRLPLKKEYCRLCWCQAREDRAVLAGDARSAVVIAPYLPGVRHHQLFFAGMNQRRARPRPAPPRPGAKGRPRKPPPPAVIGPRPGAVQLALFGALPRAYGFGRVDLRSGPPPTSPWLGWALHLAHVMAETRGFGPGVHQELNRNLVMLLDGYADGDVIRVSDFRGVLGRRGASQAHTIEILAAMGIVADDRPPVFDTWLSGKLDGLAPAIAVQARRWVLVLRDGGPRRRPRKPGTAAAYLNTVRPALLAWSQSYDHLREVTRDDVLDYLAGLRGDPRRDALAALRSLFTWAKRDGVIFANPASRIRIGARTLPVWQPLTAGEITSAVQAAATPQARLCVALAAVHAARPGQIRALLLSEVDLGDRRITIAGRPRPLDDLTRRLLTEWLDYRRARWPHTGNPHLLISKRSALKTGPVSAPWIRDLRGLPGTLDRLRIDRQLDEAIACGADPLHVAGVFGIDASTAIRYATNARQLLAHGHEARLPASPPTTNPADSPGRAPERQPR